MPVPEKYHAQFEENGIYHVYNRTNNQEKLFLNDRNRQFFLCKYFEYIEPFASTYCWCLLPNHFHFLLKVKSREIILQHLHSHGIENLALTEKRYMNNDISERELMPQAFKRFFQSYTLSLNKVHDRKGNLFNKSFKRVEVKRETQFTQTVVYVHANAVKHQMTLDFESYKWSSWQTLLSADPGLLLKDELLDWFGGEQRMINDHRCLTQYYYDCEVAIED